jgi:GNAT superfamily N-acetyltransferase
VQEGRSDALLAAGHVGMIERMRVMAATTADIPSWLEIVDEVEPLFGPMPDFRTTLENNIRRGTALAARSKDGSVLGGVLFSIRADHAVISWLAVRSTHRRAGIGTVLLSQALRLTSPLDVVVDTFGPDNAGGAPARRLYARGGFIALDAQSVGPDGTTREQWLLRRSARLRGGGHDA